MICKYAALFYVAKPLSLNSLDRMSKSLLAQATQRIKSMTEAGRRRVAEGRTADTLMLGGATSLATGAGAGYFDKKYGKDGEPHKVLGIPTVGLVGVVLTAPALVIEKLPGRVAVAMTGISLISNAAYRFVNDKTKAE